MKLTMRLTRGDPVSILKMAQLIDLEAKSVYRSQLNRRVPTY